MGFASVGRFTIDFRLLRVYNQRRRAVDRVLAVGDHLREIGKCEMPLLARLGGRLFLFRYPDLTMRRIARTIRSTEVKPLDELMNLHIPTQEPAKPDYTALLERDYPNDRVVALFRSEGQTDEEIYTALDSFGY